MGKRWGAEAGRLAMTRFNVKYENDVVRAAKKNPTKRSIFFAGRETVQTNGEELSQAGIMKRNLFQKRRKKSGKRTDQDGGLRRRAVVFKLGRIGRVVAEGVLDEGAAEADDSDATHDNDKGEPLVEVEAAVEEQDREDADEEDECATRHLEDRDWCV